MQPPVAPHVIPDEETDLSFIDFAAPGQPYAAPLEDAALSNDDAPDLSGPGRLRFLARPARLERATFRSATRVGQAKIVRNHGMLGGCAIGQPVQSVYFVPK